MKSCLPTAALFALASAASAQVVQYPLPTRGIVPSQAMGMILNRAPNLIQKKQRGLPVTLVPTAPVVGGANYTVAGIMTTLNSYSQAAGGVRMIEIDGMSTGNDDLPIIWDDNSGEFWISQGSAQGWAVLAIGVENVAPTGTDVFGYYFANPSFPSQLRNGIYTELVQRDFPLSAGHVVAMDAAMGLLQDSAGRLFPSNNPVLDRLYFTLTDSSAEMLWNDLTAPLLDELGQAYALPSGATRFTGATIFCAFYGPSGACDQVRVFEDYASLGLASTDEVDALAVGTPQAPQGMLLPGQASLSTNRLQYVFSTANPANGEQLYAAANVDTPVGGPRRAPLRGNNGDPISGGSGSIGGQFRSLCCWDPEGGNRGWTAIGEPENYNIEDSVNVVNCGFALETTNLSYSNDKFDLTGVISGWGSASPQDSLVYLFVQKVGGQLGGWQGYMALPMRSATDDYYTFHVNGLFELGWLGANEGANMNRYRFWTYQIGLVDSNITESIRSLVLRRQ